jgi:hypothetical protein
MRISTPSRLMTMSRTDKETRIKDFIAESLTAVAEGPGGDGIVTVIVRNNESPAARALCAALSETAATLDVRVIVADTRVEDASSPSLAAIPGVECRHLGDPRFGASHEQIVVGRTHVWIGDCLRRDPNKRDAFELYHKADPIARKCATVSFERLWARSRPLTPAKSPLFTPNMIANGKPEDGETLPLPLRQ